MKHPNGIVSAWTDERAELAKKLWNEGNSAAVIATTIGGGISRNAVIGRMHRLGLPSRQTVTFRRDGEKIKRANAPKARAPRRLRFTAKPALVPPPPEIFTAAHNCTIRELTNKSCRYITADDLKTYCGVPTADLTNERPYCAHHMRICYEPAKRKFVPYRFGNAERAA